MLAAAASIFAAFKLYGRAATDRRG
jgi:hypothetical protein